MLSLRRIIVTSLLVFVAGCGASGSGADNSITNTADSPNDSDASADETDAVPPGQTEPASAMETTATGLPPDTGTSTDTAPGDSEPNDTGPGDTDSNDSQPSDSQPSDSQPSDSQPSDSSTEPEPSQGGGGTAATPGDTSASGSGQESPTDDASSNGGRDSGGSFGDGGSNSSATGGTDASEPTSDQLSYFACGVFVASPEFVVSKRDTARGVCVRLVFVEARSASPIAESVEMSADVGVDAALRTTDLSVCDPEDRTFPMGVGVPAVNVTGSIAATSSDVGFWPLEGLDIHLSVDFEVDGSIVTETIDVDACQPAPCDQGLDCRTPS